LPQYFLGVDGGQSSTTALIGDETGRVLGSGAGGPCNHVGAAEGKAKLSSAVRDSVGKACEQAGLDASDVEFEAACFGMSGGPDDKRAILAEILKTRALIVSNDAVIALAGAVAGKPGIITIAGTGTIGFGRNSAGNTARVGGWGYVFGDEGGGFDIARQALRASLRFQEGWGPDTALYRMLLDVSGAANAHSLMYQWYTTDWPRPRIASLSELVDEAAAAGDGVARNILMQAAQQLAALVASVRSQLFETGEPATVAYIGGVFKSALLLERYRMLVELEEGNRVSPPVHGPAAGALLEAYSSSGLRPALVELPEFKS
jgi:N-acetylglucosamine kinase